MDLKGRDFLTLKDYTPEEILYLLDLAAELKEKKKKGILVDHHRGKNVALIFEKTSTRTRCAFEVAAHDLGMGTTYLDPSGSQIGKKESIADTARVLPYFGFIVKTATPWVVRVVFGVRSEVWKIRQRGSVEYTASSCSSSTRHTAFNGDLSEYAPVSFRRLEAV